MPTARDKGRRSLMLCALVSLLLCGAGAARGQNTASAVIEGTELTRLVPTGFYYEGQSAPTQMRNSGAVRFAPKHYVVAGMVDTSGYSTDVQAKYQGFLITDAPVSFGDGLVLNIGAYGFGFSEKGLLISDVAGNVLLTIPTTMDRTMLRPRPLAVVQSGRTVRLYAGRSYVEIAPRTAPEL